MAIYTQDYRKWEGTYRKRPYKILGMIYFGIKRAWSSNWVKLCLILGWIPAIFFIVFSLIFPSFIEGQVESMRNTLFSNYLSIQILWVILLTAVTGSSLISEDIENKSIALYYSSPIKKVDYVLGKIGIVGAFITFITLVPSTVLYWALTLIFDVEIKTGLWIWGACILYSTILVLFFSTLILFLSSLTGNGKYAGASLFGLTIGSGIIGAIIQEITENSRALLFSLLDNLSILREKLFRSLEEYRNIMGESIEWYHSFGVITGLILLFSVFTYLKLRKMELSE
jgi:ABC-type transport system involved in multi-copper enzyme maturation permease subunit